MNVNFTTDSFESRHRFEAWYEAVCSRLINAKARQIEKSEFAGDFTYGTLTDIGLARHAAQTSLLWQRTPECIRKHPDDNFYLGQITHGDGHLEQNGYATRLTHGDMVIYDAAMPFEFGMNSMTIKIIRLPRAFFDRKSPCIAKLAGAKLDAQRPGMHAMQELMSEAFSWNSAEETRFHALQFSEALLDMIAVCINMQKMQEPVRADLYHEMIKYLQRNLER
ncbi:MAG: AraC family transcriptional regulator [Pantoea sp.]|nr:AraC family transcriptional regulator [Pantoea sp.]